MAETGEENMNMDMDELMKPVKAVEEKWKMIPHFLRMRGLMRQHIDSYNHLINVCCYQQNNITNFVHFEVKYEKRYVINHQKRT